MDLGHVLFPRDFACLCLSAPRSRPSSSFSSSSISSTDLPVNSNCRAQVFRDVVLRAHKLKVALTSSDP